MDNKELELKELENKELENENAPAELNEEALEAVSGGLLRVQDVQ